MGISHSGAEVQGLGALGVDLTFSTCLSKTSVFAPMFEASRKGERGAGKGSDLRFCSRKAEEWQTWNGVWQPR